MSDGNSITTSNTTSTLTLRELLALKCLSKCKLLFEHEDPNFSDQSALLQRDNGNKKYHSQQILNAAKISLLLTKEISSRLVANNISRSSKTDTTSDLASFRIDDIIVRLKPCSTNESACTKTSQINGGIKDGDLYFLRGVEIRTKEHIAAMENFSYDDEMFSIQVARRFIHAIFSCKIEQLLPRTVSAPGEGEKGEEYNLNQASKSRKSDNDSLFYTLLETGEYPISICRLLSDVMEEGSIDTRNPITSLHDVIQDLEQMSNNPQTFLFDQGNDFYSSNLHLGQGYYGRVEELTTMLEISNRTPHIAVSEKSVQLQDDIPNQIAATEVSDSPSWTDSLNASRPTSPEIESNVDVVYVSGAAGSGKSYFLQYAGNFLTNLGWMVYRVKFRRDMEHGSREILSSLFEKLVGNLISMRDGGNVLDADYSQKAVRAISNTLDQSSLSSLAEFIPSLQQLIPEVKRTNSTRQSEAKTSHWKLVILLSKFMGSMLSLDRHIMICLDDLQWCDHTTMVLITNILNGTNQYRVGNAEHHHLLAVGMYREEAITESHPLTNQMALLQNSYNANVSEIKLSSLSRNDVVDMLSSELRLPTRLVRRLASAVYKKTSGHALFVVQLLNSLVQDSTISYSPQKHRFDWDDNKLSRLKTWDTVASLIVSNMSALKPKDLQKLRILSCFGVQSVLPLIQILDNSILAPRGGFEASLPGLVEKGVIEVSDQVISFAHDLIQQHVYESVPMEERRKLHHDIGVYLGSMTALDATYKRLSSIEGGIDELYLSDVSSEVDPIIKPAALISIATDQINAAGTQYIVDGSQRTRFAGWNLYAGKEAAENSKFEAALFHYKNGIMFLTDGLWLGEGTYNLCLELHEGAAFASFAIGNINDVALYAQAIIDHVPLEDSLVAQNLLIRSLQGAGKYSETIARGLAVLRLLGIDIPSAPSPVTVIESMQKTANVTSQYTSNQLISMKKSTLSARERSILTIVDAVIVAAYRQSSPFLPLVTCAMVNYSLQNGVCEESATAFTVYGYLRVFLEQNFEEGKRWGGIALNIMDPNSVFTHLVLYGFLLFWFTPHLELESKMAETYEISMKIGHVDNAMHAICLSHRFAFFGGRKLSNLSRSFRKSLKQMAKFNPDCLRFAIIDNMQVDDLTGVDSNPFLAFEGTIQDENSLLADLKYKNHTQGLESIYNYRFISAFWKGDYAMANKWYKEATSLAASKMLKITIVYRTFYRGLIAYQLYRNGEGEEWLDEGKTVLDKVEMWRQNANKSIFESKLILLEAEHYASNCNIVAAKESYELSAKTARDYGLVHEQGLACELYGKFLSSISESDDASKWYQRAYTSYTQWGAKAKASMLQKEHAFEIPDENNMSMSFTYSTKHRRDDEVAEDKIALS